MKASSGLAGSLMSTPIMSAPSAWASSPTRAPMPDEIPVMTIVFPRSMSAPSLILFLGFRDAVRLNAHLIRARKAEAVADRQEPQRRPVFDPAPDPPREEKRKKNPAPPQPTTLPNPHTA